MKFNWIFEPPKVKLYNYYISIEDNNEYSRLFECGVMPIEPIHNNDDEGWIFLFTIFGIGFEIVKYKESKNED